MVVSFEQSSDFHVNFLKAQFSSSSPTKIPGLEVLPLGIAIFAIDLTSTKHSRCCVEDVDCAVQALRDGTLPGLATSTSECIVALWGRSTGAVAALQYAAQDPSVAALVCDSAYSDLTKGLLVPEMFSTPLSNFCQLLSQTTANQHLSAAPLRPVEVVKACFVPAFFLHGAEDDLVPCEAARELRNNYGGEAQVMIIPKSSHHSLRPSSALARAALFLARAFNLKNQAVLQLDEYLTRLAAPKENQISQRQQKAEDWLRSDEVFKRHCGLFQMALNGCPAYRDVAFRRSLACGQKSHGQEVQGVHYAIRLKLPNREGEVCIAWASESGKKDSNDDGVLGMLGMVHFMIVSCTSLSITRVVIRRDIHNHRVAVQDLIMKEPVLWGNGTRYEMSYVPACCGCYCSLLVWHNVANLMCNYA